MKFKNLNLKPADRIVVPKSLFGLVQHHAIYIGKNEKGQHIIIENKFGVGVHAISAEQFFNGVSHITRIEKFSGRDYERNKAVQRALSKLGTTYHMLNYNCEDFANEVQYGKPESHQVANAFAGLFTALLIGAIIKNKV